MKATEPTSERSDPLNWLEGEEGPNCEVLKRSWEGEEGSAFRLGAKLIDASSPETDWHELPDGVYLPVPDRVLDVLEELSGCEVRLCLLMIRAAYSWMEDLGQFRASARWFTTSEIKEEAGGGLGMHQESLRQAADTLEARGWIEQRKSEGEATAYRWALSVPRSRYTLVPAPFFYAHHVLSHSAVTVLLSVIRATIGWASAEGDEITYRRTAELSMSDLAAMTGLSRPTVRDAQDELRGKSALYARRRHGGAPWEFAVNFSFFQAHLQNSYTPTSYSKSSNSHTGGETADRRNAPTKGGSGGRGSAYWVKEEWEREAIRRLCADPIEMDPGAARDLVIRRGKSVIEGAVKAFRRRESDIDNPGGWMYAAINQLWFGPSIPNASPDRGSEGPDQSDGLETQPKAGVSHSEVRSLIEDLGQPPWDWETVDRSGKDPLFVPSKRGANWAYFRHDSGSEEFRAAARRVVNVRARHEGRKSPIGGG
jgi:hypothetical protein